MTLEQVADAAQISRAFLSRMERNEALPSVGTLVALCRMLSISAGDVLDPPDPDLIRRGDMHVVNVSGNGYTDYLLTPRKQGRVQVIHTVASPEGTGGAELYAVNSAVEVAYVVAGTVEMRFSNHSVQLSAGDALTFSGQEPHTWVNVGTSEKAEIIWILAPAPGRER